MGFEMNKALHRDSGTIPLYSEIAPETDFATTKYYL